MDSLFEVAAGTIVGRDHCGRGNLLFGKNNQDAFHYRMESDCCLAVVCDGCSEGAYTEFGARLASQLVATSLEKHRHSLAEGRGEVVTDFCEEVRLDVLVGLREIAYQMQGGRRFGEVVGDYFLFTVVGAILTPTVTAIFSIGDGVYCLNGEINRIGPFSDNKPPYLAYGLVGSSIDPELLRFQIHCTLPTEEVQSLLIGSDGVVDLAEASDKTIPGKKESVGPLSQFWTEDHFFSFARRDQVRRRLSLINSEVVRTDAKGLVRESGLLPDDTTLVVIRRKPIS